MTFPIPSLYIHIPFCKQKCNYCDFVSYAGKESLIDEYVGVLTQEVSSLTAYNLQLKTIYFGGGTPSLLRPEHYKKILGLLVMRRLINKGTEISIESNPGTINQEFLKQIRALGLNRLSIGVQSFNDKHLKTLGRIHDSKEAVKAYKDARAAGFTNINIDLIYALPGQTLEAWKNDLAKAIDLKPNHLSIYNLQIEEGTPFWPLSHPSPPTSIPASHPQLPNLSLPSEETELAMFDHTIKTLTASGYKHYEISNFAKPGCECKHNINYWQNGNYIGLGAGAHSHLNGQRWSNTNSIEEYLGTATLSRRFSGAIKSDRQETIFLGLRLLDGLPKVEFTGFEKEVNELMKDGLLEEKNRNYRLTRRGLCLGNLVFAKFV